MTIHAPQIILLFLMVIGFEVTLRHHGEPREDKYDAWLALIGSIVLLALLWWGGFFN